MPQIYLLFFPNDQKKSLLRLHNTQIIVLQLNKHRPHQATQDNPCPTKSTRNNSLARERQIPATGTNHGSLKSVTVSLSILICRHSYVVIALEISMPRQCPQITQRNMFDVSIHKCHINCHAMPFYTESAHKITNSVIKIA